MRFIPREAVLMMSAGRPAAAAIRKKTIVHIIDLPDIEAVSFALQGNGHVVFQIAGQAQHLAHDVGAAGGHEGHGHILARFDHATHNLAQRAVPAHGDEPGHPLVGQFFGPAGGIAGAFGPAFLEIKAPLGGFFFEHLFEVVRVGIPRHGVDDEKATGRT